MNQNEINEQVQQTQQVQQNDQRKGMGKKYLAVVLLLLLFIGISIGYAGLSSSLNISGSSTINDNTKWDIDVLDNSISCPNGEICQINPSNPGSLTPDDGKVTPENPNPTGAVIWTEGNTVYFKHVLTAPGDVFTFNTTFKNNGTLNAKVSDVVKSNLNTTAQNFMTYTVTYANGNTINVNDTLAAGQSATFKVTVTYKAEVQVLPTPQQLAEINETAQGHTGATSFFTVTYVQA